MQMWGFLLPDARNDISREKIIELLDYDPDTGFFHWKERLGDNRFNKRYAGKRVGIKDSYGYLKIRLNGREYKLHRLAYLIMTGRWPEPLCDHINRIKDDNRWINLREITNRDNLRNRNNNSGFPGVYYRNREKRWRAHTTIDGKYVHIGHFGSAEEAHQAWLKVAPQ